MENIHHIHEVLEILSNPDKVYTVEDLSIELSNEYGDDVHFATCSERVFPIQEVVPFLLSKNKIRLSENMIIPLAQSCNH